MGMIQENSSRALRKICVKESNCGLFDKPCVEINSLTVVVEAADEAEVLAAFAHKMIFQFDADFFQCFQTINTERQTNHIN